MGAVVTTEEWIEHVFHHASEMGKYLNLHDKVDAITKQYPNMSYVRRLEIAYQELLKENEKQVELLSL